ncbi:MAG: hypothetical protein PUP91_21425 [Rhizonema sp. PD37]|nr:hypothetical protein [Rhizonema sp. PD37]
METKKEKLDRIIKDLVARRVGVQEACVFFIEHLELITTPIRELDYESIRKMAGKCVLLAKTDDQNFDGVMKVERETNKGYQILVPLTPYHCLFVEAIKSENDIPGELKVAIVRTIETLKPLLNGKDSFNEEDQDTLWDKI